MKREGVLVKECIKQRFFMPLELLVKMATGESLATEPECCIKVWRQLLKVADDSVTKEGFVNF